MPDGREGAAMAGADVMTEDSHSCATKPNAILYHMYRKAVGNCGKRDVPETSSTEFLQSKFLALSLQVYQIRMPLRFRLEA